jgi:hypothetical protein
MNENIRTADSGTNLHIVEGMTVYDAGGDKVGTLDAYNAEAVSSTYAKDGFSPRISMSPYAMSPGPMPMASI